MTEVATCRLMRRFAQVWAGQPTHSFDDVSEGIPRFSKMQDVSTSECHDARGILRSEVGIFKTADRQWDPRSFPETPQYGMV